MNYNFKNLIGFQLVGINDSEIKLKKGDKTFTLSILEDKGDCCGGNGIATNLFISKEELNRNPIITNVTVERCEDDYSQTCKIVFFGEEKNIAQLNTNSYSGSGWHYGACVSIECKDLELNEILSSW